MAYELRSARYLATDALRQVIRPGDTVIISAGDLFDGKVISVTE